MIRIAENGNMEEHEMKVWCWRNTVHLDGAWNTFVQREAMSFAVQAGTRGWLKGASYSLNQDRFIVTDAPALQASLLAHLNAVTDKEEAAFAAIAISRLKQDGAALDATVLKQGITTTTYQTLFDAVLDDGSGAIYGQQGNGGFAIDTGNGIVALGMGGNDYLYGGSGNDVIDGGAGNDTLHGGGGSDTYVFGTGAGQDTVDDYAVTADAGDRVRMSAEVMPGDVTVTRDQYHLYLNLNGGADRMSLQYWFSNNVYKHKSVTFADGTVWDATELERRIKPLPGTSGADNLFGGTADNTLDGGVGNDSLSGGTGDDTYVFGNGYGQDTVIEDPATDTTAFNQDTVQMLADVAPADVMVTRDQNNLYLNLNGGADRLTISNWFGGQANRIERVTFNDGTEWTAQDLVSRIVVQPGTPGADSIRGDETDNVIDGLAGNDQLFGNGGDDTLRGGVGNDALDGGNGNDVLDGGAGNDSLNGGAGDDSYVFGNGYGQDVINDYDWTAGNVDTVTMAEGIVPDDVVVTRDWGNLYLSLNNGADRLTLANWFGDAYKVERVAFADGTVWDAAELDARIAVTPASEGNDTVSGNAAGNLIEGLGGNDALYGYGGDDTLKGGSGNDYLLGDTGNDILDGGAGSDTLSGGVGNDTYVFGNGYGQDTVSEYDWTAGNIDTVALTDGVAPGDVTVTRDQYNLYLSLNNGADRLTLPNWFYGDGNRIEQVAFADGTVWSGADLVNRAAVVPGTEGKDFIAGASAGDAISGLGGDDQLYGNDGNDTLSGGSGNDFIDGGNGDDVLDGGAGHDALNGGDGSDSYVFGHGYGQDVVYEYDGNLANMDTVAMALGVVPEDVTVTRDQSHLYLSLNNGTDRLTLVNWFYGDAYRIDQVTFADGTVWGATELGSRVVIAPGTAGDDVILGDEASNAIDGLGGNDRIDGAGGADTLTGGAGNDRLDGGAGDDLIDGGSGTDVLVGGAGNDIYLFGPGSGQDSVIEADSTAGNVDTVRFVDTVSPVDVSVTRDWNNLFLSLNNGADRLTLQNWFYGDAYKVEGVVFGDGTEWSVAELASRVTVAPGTEGADYLSGNDSSVRLNWPPPAGKPTRGTVSRDSWVSTI
jgi:Ca2+-binding RTX toxin-like protein